MIPPQQDSEKESITEGATELEEKVGAESLQEDGPNFLPTEESLKDDDASSVSLLIDKLIRKLIDNFRYRNIAAGALFILISIFVIASTNSDSIRMLMITLCTFILLGWIIVGQVTKWAALILVAVCFLGYLIMNHELYHRGILKDHWKEQHMQVEKLHQSSD